MLKKFWGSIVIILLSVNLVSAAESKTVKNAVATQPEHVTESDKESLVPVPPKAFKDPATGLEMVYVKGGCYKMGNTFSEGGAEEKPVHEVCVQDFYLGKYEVTQSQWEKIMGTNPSLNSKCGGNCPVDTVSWSEVQDFISKLNLKSKGNYSLPTEAEWEYAARSGGKSELYSGGNVLVDVAWYFDYDGEDDYRWGIKPVGTKLPNGLGVYDMTGNVWEWTNDWYSSDYYKNSPRNNPAGPDSGERRVLRGGSWRNGAFDLRSTYRNFLPPNYRSDSIGLRLLRKI